IDLSHMEEAEREAEAVRLAREEAALPFDLATGPLVRASLVRLSGKEHVCLLTMHHIVSDGWSVGVLIKEVAALYEAYASGQESPLAELPVQYADYAVWQREHLRGEALDKQLAYWRQQLAGAPAALELPTDRPRPPVQTSNGARRKFELSPRVSGRLRELSSREGVTLYMTLLAAFQTLLARYSNQEDISVGTPVANRQRGETEGLIGFFVNTLVMRAQVKADESFTRLLGRVREACLGAYAHQDAPFERLVEELVEERDLSRTPLFQVWFVLHNRTEEELELPGLQLRALEGENSTAKHDLTLDVQDAGECLTGILEYNTDLFDASTAERMVRHFEHLLEAIAADPVRRVGDLPLLSEGELRRMLYEWNDTAADYPREACLHELFEQQAARTPEAAAVVHEGERLSYGELDERANRVARHLRTLGVGPEVLVGICAERSLEMVVGLLGVLKAGGAYVPLDPTYPAERLDYMLKDASVSVVLLQQRFAASLPAHGARVVYLDADREALGPLDTGRVESGVTARNLAYVIYTSGSTGKPKGVLIPHASVVNHNFAVAERYELTSSDRVLQFASLNFDVAVEEIFPTWLRGGCVVLRSEQLLNSDATFFDFVEREGVTAVNLPTPYWNELIAARSRSKAQGPLGLRLVAIGGEKGLPENFAATLPHLAPGARLMNVYGPTETTVTNTAHEFRADERASASVPIGRPIGNTRLYVLDHGLRPVPVGVASELFIGGHSLARGYLARPALTA
ncbi:MAG TPA: amino acid adenylation domain-containing protein, partial [Pyrinomonadaceae bacterium]|nr:amino acid adenylation domain-containing protein [Pyrinomonadaceae bacterium]